MSATIGILTGSTPATDHPGLLAAPVLTALRSWAQLDATAAGRVAVAQIDPELSDTAAFVERYQVPPGQSVNCVVIAGRRDGVERVAAALVPATTRADVNGILRRVLDVRKASFLAMDEAVERTGMEYGGITPIGLPAPWRVLVDGRVPDLDLVVIGSGVRHSKLLLPGAVLAGMPGAEVVDGLGRELSPAAG